MKLLSKALPAPGLDGSIEMRTSQHALCAWLRQCQGRSRRWLREHARMPSRERRAALAMAVVLFGVVIWLLLPASPPGSSADERQSVLCSDRDTWHTA